MVLRLTTPSPPRQTIIGAVMSDDVNYVSDYFYTERPGPIGSARASRGCGGGALNAEPGCDYQRMRDDCGADSQRH